MIGGGRMRENNDQGQALTSIRNHLYNTGVQFKKEKLEKAGVLSANDLNAFANIMRSSAYVESIRLQQERSSGSIVVPPPTELSESDKKRLDEIAKLLCSKEASESP